MKTKISGSGVKAANRFQIVSKIEGKKYWTKYHIERMKSPDLIHFWNYKLEGLTLDVAKLQLIKCIETRDQVAAAKPKRWHGKAKGKYTELLSEKKKRIADFLAACEKLEPAQRAYHYNYGNYKYKQRTFILTNKTEHPFTMSVSWCEDHDWEFYSKRYGYPKSTYSDRCVIFKTIGKLGVTTDVFTYPLESFSGNFVERAIAAFYKVGKVKVEKELKPVQLADFFALHELHKVNGYRLFERRIGEMVWDYAILDPKTHTTYHSNSQEQLIPGLRAKIEAKSEVETAVITKATGFALGFCETGMRSFCADNNIDFDGSYPRKDLRNIVVANREINLRKYRKELSKIGIKLS